MALGMSTIHVVNYIIKTSTGRKNVRAWARGEYMMKKTITALILMMQSFGALYASESAIDTLKTGVSPSVLENSSIPRPPLAPPEFRRYLAKQEALNLDNSKRAHKTTWSTLTILQFIPKTVFSKAGGLVVDDGQSTWAGHMAAARQIDIVFVEIRGVSQINGINQVREIAKALSGHSMNLKDFADRMNIIYVFPKDAPPAEAKASMGKSTSICFYKEKQLPHSGNCERAVIEYQIANEGYSFDLDTGGSRGNCYLVDSTGHRVQSLHESYCGLTDADFAPGGTFGRADDGGNSYPDDGGNSHPED